MRKRPALAVVLSGTFLANLDVFIVVVAVPAIERGLHANEGQQQLVLAGYQLVYGLGLVAGGRLGDHVGAFRIFGIGTALFTAASLGCGLAPTAGALVAARLVQGLGTALVVPQAYRTAQTLFAGDARRQAFALTGAVMGSGAVCGQLLGGWLLAADVLGLGWRAVFLVNVPVGVAALAALPWVTGTPRRPRQPGHGPLPEPGPEPERAGGRGPEAQPERGPGRRSAGPRVRLDLPGTALAALALGLVTAPLVTAGESGPPWWTVPCAVVSLPAAVLFLRHERAVQRRGGDPLLPPHLLRLPGFRPGLALVALVNSGLGAFILILGLLLQRGLRQGPWETGLGMLPTAGAFVVTSLLGPRLPVAPFRLLCGAALLSTAGYLGCVVSAVRGDLPWLLVGLGVSGAGLGLFVTPSLAVTLRTVPARMSGAASGVLSTVQQLAAALGVCVFGTLFFALVHSGTGHPGAFAAVTAAIATTTAAGGVLAAVLRPAAPSPEAAAPAAAGEGAGRPEATH